MVNAKISVATVIHNPLWLRWPETQDVDFSSVLNPRWTQQLRRGDDVIEITHRHLPAFYPHTLAGVLEVPGGQVPLMNNNLVDVHPAVIAKMLEVYEAVGKECQVLAWHGVYQCYPKVADRLKSFFNFTTFRFSDDCPQSSEYKTWPIAHGFDLARHQMYIWNYETGEKVADAYKARGCPHTFWVTPAGGTGGLEQRAKDERFDFDVKVKRIEEGIQPLRLVYVGANGYPNPLRVAFLTGLNANADRVEALGVQTRLFGYRMRDGVLGDRNPLAPNPQGWYVWPEYEPATFTVNYPVSSLHNSRLLDAWYAGIIQFIPDRWKELEATLGARAGEHFIDFDGTFKGFLTALETWKDRRADLAQIARNGREMHAKVCARDPSAWYFDHLDQILNGRRNG